MDNLDPNAPPAAPASPSAQPPTGQPGAPAAANQVPTDEPDVDPNAPHVIQTDADAKDGLTKCPRCGATEIALNVATGDLRCGYCRFEFAAENAMDAFDLNGDIGKLEGLTVGSGSSDIVPSTDEVMTFKCSACGAEVLIDTASSTQARCHWCRNTLSMNQQVPNGAVPDMILPFKLPKETAISSITKFVKKRRFFAHPRFRAEFTPENVMGVYLPYMVVDVNAHATLSGQGEHQTRRYTVKVGDNNETRYDADLYNVERDFDIHVNDLTVESSSERLDQNASQNSNNIINTIMPFDVENSVKYDSNYLAGFSSERRDSNLEELSPIAHAQAEDVTRHRVNETLKFYDRGVRWTHQDVDVRGQRWVSAYLPVWLYSYQQRKSNGKTFLHYVAVNARTGETMGSVPIHQSKLWLVSGAVEVAGIITAGVLLLLGI